MHDHPKVRAVARTGLILAVLSIATVACGRDEPTRTEVLCGGLLAADDATDSDAVEGAVEQMLDLGTDADPLSVQPEIYARALLIQDAIRAGSQASFNARLDDLLSECRRVTRGDPEET
jgi:hypothetical protein